MFSIFVRDSNVDVRHKLAKILASASSSPVLNNENCLLSSDIPPPPPLSSNASSNALSEKGNSGGSGSGQDEPGNVSNYYCDTPINDLVDPVDYEDYIVSNSSRISAELRPIVLFPPDDIQVEKYEPPLRTLDSASTPEFDNVQTFEDPFIQSIGAYAPKSLLIIKKYIIIMLLSIILTHCYFAIL